MIFHSLYNKLKEKETNLNFISNGVYANFQDAYNVVISIFAYLSFVTATIKMDLSP